MVELFLVGFLCFQSGCDVFHKQKPYQSAAECVVAAQEVVARIVERFGNDGLVRAKTYCAIGPEVRDELLEMLRNGIEPLLGGKDA